MKGAVAQKVDRGEDRFIVEKKPNRKGREEPVSEKKKLGCFDIEGKG